ncbi:MULTISPECIES: response regulator [Sulfurospirillum]|uniref:Chemotaxis regulator CheY n=3 Tax=Sulfurospirillum TaxID=57665 RepID=A0A1D7THX1_9BACT|nr:MULTISPECIES: response regulator [Sulfurospirillum]AHJ12034.1 chemotaxis regulator CheY [Sulfurospirillum multivorans DSM 12446]AOO64540.1 chemotaxis regulator CheY [Sulfurospirillum halorespirans DSM 13726]QEH05537.1 chemotaxis regulator CheY [Sulfurospirillum multivorans]
MEKQLKILAVDDDFINLKLISSMLRKNVNVGIIIEATNGLDAINLLKTQGDIDLVLLDIKMPVMDGIEFLTNIQSMNEFKKLPVIVLTTDETRKHEAFEHGAFDFLVKPIREHDLSSKIAKVADLY